jgi:hypothetical protein
MTLSDPTPWLLLVAGAHLGFQLTIDLVVYPALGEVADDRWTAAHERHSRRVTPLVAVVYPSLLGVLCWSAAAEPGEAGTWLAVAGGALAMVATAAVAAPLHGRLGSATEADRRALLRRLAVTDRVRTAGAAVCVLGVLLSAA